MRGCALEGARGVLPTWQRPAVSIDGPVQGRVVAPLRGQKRVRAEGRPKEEQEAKDGESGGK
jgi:hypothetical protein